MNKFICYSGNNSKAVRQALVKRGNWEEVKKDSPLRALTHPIFFAVTFLLKNSSFRPCLHYFALFFFFLFFKIPESQEESRSLLAANFIWSGNNFSIRVNQTLSFSTHCSMNKVSILFYPFPSRNGQSWMT